MKFVRKCIILFSGNPLTAPGNSGVRPKQPCAVSLHPGGYRATLWRFPCLTDTYAVILEIPQVVWKASTQVGCAEASCSGIFAASFGLAKYFVCEYSPQGNVIGEFAYVSSTLFDNGKRILLIPFVGKTCKSEYPTFSRFRVAVCLYFVLFCRGWFSAMVYCLASCLTCIIRSACSKRCCHHPRDVCMREPIPTGSTRSSQSPGRGMPSVNAQRSAGKCALLALCSLPRCLSGRPPSATSMSFRRASPLSTITYIILVLITAFFIGLSCALLLSQSVRTAPNRGWAHNFNAAIIGAAYALVVRTLRTFCVLRVGVDSGLAWSCV